MNIQDYSVVLFTSFEKNKTTSAVAEEIGINQSSASRFLKSINLNKKLKKKIVKNLKFLFTFLLNNEFENLKIKKKKLYLLL